MSILQKYFPDSISHVPIWQVLLVKYEGDLQKEIIILIILKN